MRLFALCLAVVVGINALLVFLHGDAWTWTAFVPSLVAGVGVGVMFFWPDLRRRLPLPRPSPKAEPPDPPWAGIRARTGAGWVALGFVSLDLFVVDTTSWEWVLRALTIGALAWALVRNRAIVRVALADRRTRLRCAGLAFVLGSLAVIKFTGDGPVAYALVGLVVLVLLVWPRPFLP
jgi:hypothetical protein